ncbi:glucoamylase family protein [Sphingobacterium sp. LRF_L2]|uniref:glucoamylase family protein n=1 Tax=Sphingobacterium sp. LRF_L2 TaxID=3369421 RepID=UPI003F5E9D1F
MNRFIFSLVAIFMLTACKKETDSENTGTTSFKLSQIQVDNITFSGTVKNVSLSPNFLISFEKAVSEQSINSYVEIFSTSNIKVALKATLSTDKKSVTIQTSTDLTPFTTYSLIVRSSLLAEDGNKIDKEYSYLFTTGIDNNDKFERISTDELLTKIQQQTFKYFWDIAHPSYGMIRERDGSGETVTTGGTGFGIMAILVGIERGFITREQGLERTKKIVSFFKLADRYHGAFSHWYNGSTGKTQPFSDKDNGADLVETSLLFQGLITAKSFFNDTELSNDITGLYNAVEWNFFKNEQQVLFWHWSPDYNWDMNLKITGWNEALITYVLAAGSSTYGIDLADYEQGWAANGAIKNGASYYSIQLPLGTANGGPLFLSQYSFLGLNPTGLQDQYASYEQQVKNHTLINRAYCIANPQNFAGYSADCWGLTASDDINGYMAHSPSNDNGVISPTAALSAIPYTPEESLQAMEFFYYKLGDKIWGEYGFKDAFSIHEPWFATSYLAIDQGPIIIGIENYRTGLLWKYFMQSTEVKNALQKLKFTSPNI